VKQLNSGIPNLGAILGPAIGLGAARVTACHFIVMAGDVGSLFNAGPNVVAGIAEPNPHSGSGLIIDGVLGATFEENLTLEELGGPSIHCTNGTVDNLAANEKVRYQSLRLWRRC
jgi:acetyl-CoA carboxylase carboxyltransferase component